MYKEPGYALRIVANFVFWVGCIAVVIIAFTVESVPALARILIIIVGVIASYLNGLFVAGFGELIEKATEIANSLRHEVPKRSAMPQRTKVLYQKQQMADRSDPGSEKL